MSIVGIPDGAQVKIYTITGQLVKEWMGEITTPVRGKNKGIPRYW
jgi:hypothetical protein